MAGIRGNRTFCPDWVADVAGRHALARLVEHVELTIYAVGIGTVIAIAGVLGLRRGGSRLFGVFSASSTPFRASLFQLLVPVTGLTVTTVEIALVSRTRS